MLLLETIVYSFLLPSDGSLQWYIIFYLFSCWQAIGVSGLGILGIRLLWWLLNKSSCRVFFISLRNGIVGLVGKGILDKKLPKSLSKSFYFTVPSSSIGGWSCSISSVMFTIIHIFNFSLSSGHFAGIYYSFHLHFPVACWLITWNPFVCLLPIHILTCLICTL